MDGQIHMGLVNRFSTIFKAKANSTLDKFENPDEMLDYSFEKQTELINNLRRNIAQVITAKNQLQMQKSKLSTSIATLEQQADHALELNREDLARQALERKNTISMQIQNLDKQILDMQAEQYKLENTEIRLSAKVEEFKTRKEVIKAQYSSAKAQVKITESVTGISEEMHDVGAALDRAEDKTQKMKARAQALDEMIDTGVLTDYTSSQGAEGVMGGADIGSELDKVSMQQSVEQELAKMKAEHKAVQ
jgi:phage shock protein A